MSQGRDSDFRKKLISFEKVGHEGLEPPTPCASCRVRSLTCVFEDLHIAVDGPAGRCRFRYRGVRGLGPTTSLQDVS